MIGPIRGAGGKPMAENGTVTAPGPAPTFREALAVWVRIGLLSFGGPAGQIALMHRILVEEKRWVSEARFLHALNFCMLLPGPEAQQLATYIGWLLHGLRGGLVAGILFVLPGFLVILGLSTAYALYQETAWLGALFFGLKAAVLAVVIEALLRVGRRALKKPADACHRRFCLPGDFRLRDSIPRYYRRRRPDRLAGREGATRMVSGNRPWRLESGICRSASAGNRHTTGRSRATQSHPGDRDLWGALGGAGDRNRALTGLEHGVPAHRRVLLENGGGHVRRGLCGAGLCCATGGGDPWLAEAREMLDGLALAETTPGPLILVLVYVGYLAAFRDPGSLAPLTAGLLGATLTTWVTFVPCFLWIFLGAPYIERLAGNRALSGALTAVTAAVVGVILNLAVWFGLHTLFTKMGQLRVGPVDLPWPHWASLDPAAAVLALVAMLAMFRFRLGMLPTLALCGGLGFLWRSFA